MKVTANVVFKTIFYNFNSTFALKVIIPMAVVSAVDY